MKIIYGYAIFIGANFGLAVGTGKSWIEIICMGLGLIGWAAVCRMDNYV